MTEIRVVDPVSGGEKGSKPERFDLIPVEALEAIARVYGIGSAKYADRNWERGYRYGLSFAAMMRHAWAWWRGEDRDRESGESHMAHVAWHALALMTFRSRRIGSDDRVTQSAHTECWAGSNCGCNSVRLVMRNAPEGL
jgi:hypothetical protein